MPVNPQHDSALPLIQREQYAKGGLGRWYWDWRDKTILDYIGPEDQNILDLGCGEGITLERLLRKFPGRNIQGIDVLQENIAICESFRLPVRWGNVSSVDEPDSSQDVVLFLEVIEHLPEPAIAIREIHRILRPGGKLVILFPNDRLFFIARLLTLRFREAFYDPGHLFQWTVPTINNLISPFGFRMVDSKRIPFYFWAICLHGLVVAVKEI